MNVQHVNCVASRDALQDLISEARKIGALEAADELAARCVEIDAALSEYPALEAETVKLRVARDVASNAAAVAIVGFREGRVSFSEKADAVQAESVLNDRLVNATAAVVAHLQCRVENKIKEALAPFRTSCSTINGIVDQCLVGYGYEWAAADRDRNDAVAARYEALAIARAIAEYPALAKRPEYRNRAQPLERLKECFEYRSERRRDAAPAPSNEVVTREPQPRSAASRDERRI